MVRDRPFHTTRFEIIFLEKEVFETSYIWASNITDPVVSGVGVALLE